MNEWNREELVSFFEEGSTGLVYFFTPMCGSCQVASKMLAVIEKMNTVKMGRMNLNFFPDLAQKFIIESVPCLLLVKDGNVFQKIYAVHSVPYLLEKINELQSLKEDASKGSDLPL